jgi:hypothetical protein
MTFLGSITTPLFWPTTLTLLLPSLPLKQTGEPADSVPIAIFGKDRKIPLAWLKLKRPTKPQKRASWSYIHQALLASS